MRIADLATGSGDIPRRSWLITPAASAAVVTVDAVDQQPSTVEIARGLSSNYPEIEFIEGDILTFARESYDIVLCSLALHHFSENSAIALLRHCRELSKNYVLVSDLRRGWLASAGVYLLTALIFREEMTQVDARLSERAGLFLQGNSAALPNGPDGKTLATRSSPSRARRCGSSPFCDPDCLPVARRYGRK